MVAFFLPSHLERLRLDCPGFFSQWHLSKLLNKYYGDLIIPDGLRVIAINRGEERIFPAMDTMFLDGDRVIVFTNYASGKGIAKVFGRNAVTES